MAKSAIAKKLKENKVEIAIKVNKLVKKL